MDKQFYSLKEASTLTGVPVKTLQTMLARRKISGQKVLNGKKEEWALSPETLLHLRDGKPSKNYDALVELWKMEQASGYHNGKPVSVKTINAYSIGLDNYWRFLGQSPSLEAITPENIRRALSSVPINYEAKKCGWSTKQKIYEGILSFSKLLVREKLMSPLTEAEFKKYKPKRVFPPVRKSLNEEQFDRLVKHAAGMKGKREVEQACTYAVILLMGMAGLRRGEVAGLRMQDVDFERGLVYVVDGKGHKNRPAGMAIEVEDALKRWLSLRPHSESQALLLNKFGEPLTGNAIRSKVKRLAKSAGLDIASHGLRRTCATLASDRGVPAEHIRLQLGHSDLRTTQESYLMTDSIRAAASFRPSVKEAPRVPVGTVDDHW